MPFIYKRTIRFQDTDAAGVVYFANVLAICHEAYEESLNASGINLKSFFSNPAVGIPIVHASVDFFRPMFCGEQQIIYLTPKQLTNNEFEIAYQIVSAEVAARVEAYNHTPLTAKAKTKHVCIDLISRTRTDLSAEMIQWVHQWSDAAATL